MSYKIRDFSKKANISDRTQIHYDETELFETTEIDLPPAYRYYPLQIPSILDNHFIKNIDYQEYLPIELQNHIMCIWSMDSYHPLKNNVANVILPDGCIDLIIDFHKKEIYFSATSKATLYFPLKGDIHFMGVRIRPGVFYNIFRFSCSKVMDRQIPYRQIETDYPFNNIFKLKSKEEQRDFLRDYFIQKTCHCSIDPFTDHLNNKMQKNHTNSVTILARSFGYSERQLHRLFKERCGVNAKTFLNILRLHTSLQLMMKQDSNRLIEYAHASGFYDESHFIKEIKKYCGISPTELIERYHMS